MDTTSAWQHLQQCLPLLLEWGTQQDAAALSPRVPAPAPTAAASSPNCHIPLLFSIQD